MFITYICISERQIVQNYIRNRILMFTIIQVSQDNRFIQGNIFPNVNILNWTCWLIYQLTLYVPSTFLRTLLLDIKLSLGTLVTPSTPTPHASCLPISHLYNQAPTPTTLCTPFPQILILSKQRLHKVHVMCGCQT